MRRIFEGQTGIDAEMWRLNFDSLASAVTQSMGQLVKGKYNSADFKLTTQLLNNAGVFAAFKSHNETGELVKLLVDENGKPRTFAEFQKVAMPITEQYNKTWLKTEHNQATSNATMAKKWNDFARTADLYPNLEYRAVNDSHTRASHAELDGTILPIDDPFWKTHYPPNGWGCRCDVVRTDKPTTQSAPSVSPEQGFDNNPGIDGKLFSDNAGYYNTPIKAEVNNQARNLIAATSRADVRKLVRDLAPTDVPRIGKVSVSNADIKAITGKKHDDEFGRNLLLFDLKRVLQEAELVKEVPESKGRTQYIKWWYLKVKGRDGMYLNVVQMKSGDIKLHAITDKIQ